MAVGNKDASMACALQAGIGLVVSMSPGLRTLIYAVLVLGVLLGYLPWQVLRLDTVIGEHVGTLLTYGGVSLFLAGALLLFSGAYYLVLRGDGTPLPFDP